MAISSEDALKMVDAALASEAPQASATSETETASAQTTGADVKNNGVVDAEAKTETDSESVEGKAKESVGDAQGDSNKKKPSDSKKSKRANQQRVDYSFKKLKEQIKDKDEYIAKLEAQLKQTSQLTEEDFAGDKKGFQQHLVNDALAKRDLEDAKKWKENATNEATFKEFASGMQEKADHIFEGNDEESEHFSRLFDNGFEKFSACVNAHDPNGVVFEFLDDSRNAPLVLRTLMTNPDALKRVLDHRSPLAMMHELQVMENNITIRRNLAARKATSAKPLPKLGSMVKTEGSNGDSNTFDDAWGANYLKNHKRKF